MVEKSDKVPALEDTLTELAELLQPVTKMFGDILPGVLPGVEGDDVAKTLRHAATREMRDNIIKSVLTDASRRAAKVFNDVAVAGTCHFPEDGTELAFMFFGGKAIRVAVTALEDDDAAEARKLFADIAEQDI